MRLKHLKHATATYGSFATVQNLTEVTHFCPFCSFFSLSSEVTTNQNRKNAIQMNWILTQVEATNGIFFIYFLHIFLDLIIINVYKFSNARNAVFYVAGDFEFTSIRRFY